MMTPERIAELREVANAGGFDNSYGADAAVVECLDEIESLQEQLAKAMALAETWASIAYNQS